MIPPWPRPFAWKDRRYWLRQLRFYLKHPECYRVKRWAHKHSKKHPDHRVWRDCNVSPRGGTACFDCNIWVGT
jgi:hypothetical protein